jgi:hypothetical protein
MNRLKKKIFIISTCALMLLGIFALPQVTSAQEISVNGNGSTNTSISIINKIQEIDSSDGNTVINSIGNDAIITGTIQNATIDANCNCEKVHTKPTSPSAPVHQPTNNSVPASSSTSPGNVLGSGSTPGGPGLVLTVALKSLPVTGNYWFFIAFIGNILMMLLGGYLRLRSGRSPGICLCDLKFGPVLYNTCNEKVIIF